MRLVKYAIAAGALALGLAVGTMPARAQGPLYDQVKVNLPYSVTVGDKTLPPGDYVIQQLRSPGEARWVLLIYGNNGTKFQTSAMTIPTLNMTTPDSTQVILHHYGPDYYFDKIWIQGKNYGYEFPLPPSVKEREKERMQPVSLAATYQAVPPAQQQAAAPPPPTPAPQPAPQTQAEAAPPPQPQPQPQPQAAPPPAPAPTPSANRQMPKTSADWVMMLLGGSGLSGLGLMLRRKRS
jgi:pyruvate/2-oxoglutarate dehydrogenase complex dihydrolipoamide acyltransferase (E2) component